MSARLPVRAWQVQSDSSCLFRACKIVDGWFRQLERVVRLPAGFVKRISQGGMTEHPKNGEPFGLSLPLCLQSKLPRIVCTPMLEQHPLQDDSFSDLHGMEPFPV